MAKKFPTPQEVTDQQSVAWRSTEDMVEIANNMNSWSYTSLCQTNKEWWSIGKPCTWGRT